VPGLDAKPILGVAATVPSAEVVPRLVGPLGDLGYVYRGDAGDDGGHLFVPQVDTFGVMPYQGMDMISMNPVDPIGAYTHVELLGELSPESIDKLVELAGAIPGSSCTGLGSARRPRWRNVFRSTWLT
jgi:hypothetical protein